MDAFIRNKKKEEVGRKGLCDFSVIVLCTIVVFLSYTYIFNGIGWWPLGTVSNVCNIFKMMMSTMFISLFLCSRLDHA
jgi:hypothetical protein